MEHKEPGGPRPQPVFQKYTESGMVVKILSDIISTELH